MKIFNILNKRSISTKILWGFLFVFIIFSFLVLSFFRTAKFDRDNLKKISLLTSNSAKILNANRGITEIQRLTDVYGKTGSSSVLEKIEKSYASIKKELTEVSKKTSNKEKKDKIKTLIEILNSYGENISSLEKRYKFREKLLDIEIPRVLSKIEKFLGEKVSYAKSKNNKVKIILYGDIQLAWSQVNIYASKFLSKRDYRYKRKLKEKIFYIKETIVKNRNVFSLESIKILNTYEEEFYDIFDRAIQANRIYLSLVNVVMSGYLLEFSTLSKELRSETLIKLNQLLIQSENRFNHNLNRSLVFFTIAFLLMVIIALYFRKNVAEGIRDISNTFDGFLNGDLSREIPGLDRGDEIGQLAKAADAFKIVSKNIKKEQERAERLTQSKSEFLANMSHEIRTPMNGILGMVTLLRQSSLDEKQVDMLKTIDSCGENLLTILNDVLDFSKIEAGKLSVEYHSFDIKRCIDEISFLFKDRAIEKGLDYKCHIEGDLPKYIMGDVTRLKQIIINLLSNALKFTEIGGIAFIIEAANASSSSCLLKFKVKDTGVGISEESLEKLFNPFTQADASITRRFGGTGLGLSISTSLAKLMGGKLYARSVIGEGSEFILELSLSIANKLADETEHILDRELSEDSLSILVVEDNDINIRIIQSFLLKLGFHCKIAINGEIAVKMCESMNFDLVFMDMQMPVMDGVTATLKIREKLSKDDLPIVAMTANAFEEDRKKCFDAGMNDFISKPVKMAKLTEVLRSYINKK